MTTEEASAERIAKRVREQLLVDDARVARERRFQSVLLTLATTLLVAFIGWSGGMLMDLNRSAGVTAVSLQSLSEKVGTMYRSDDAKRDILDNTARSEANGKRIDATNTRIDKVEVRVDRLEKHEKN